MILREVGSNQIDGSAGLCDFGQTRDGSAGLFFKRRGAENAQEFIRIHENQISEKIIGAAIERYIFFLVQDF
ncbi:MAG: hypothetical protein ACE5HS_07590 [bacterium]